MEAAGAAPTGHHHQQLATNTQRGLPPGLPGLDVVRALHQTVISLRTALDSSREELRRLKEAAPPDFSSDNYNEAVERLALENHVLRKRLLDRHGEFSSDAATSPPPQQQPPKSAKSVSFDETVTAGQQPPEEPSAKMEAETTEPSSTGGEDNPSAENSKQPAAEQPAPAASDEVDGSGKKEAEDEAVDAADQQEKSASENSLTAGDAEENNEDEEQPQNKLSSQGVSAESENESEELDDIELIFTTEETCRDVGLQEDLVSITDADNWQQQQARTPTPNEQHKSVLKIGQSKSADGGDTMLVCNGGNGGNSINDKAGSVDEAVSSQSSSIDREESVDRFDESSSSRLNHKWSQISVLVETDISKCGMLEEVDLGLRHAARRNTLAAPPAAYSKHNHAVHRPIIHREALAAGRRKSSAPLRPVMDRGSPGSSGPTGDRRESGAQTDISALPAQWRSESYLAHKVAHTFTTLPSKFALPAGVPGRLRLSDKTREARRVMLSDISFTSMVPELSRSADHLCHEPHNQFPQPHCYGSRSGATGVAGPTCAGLRTPESNRRESWARGGPGLPSPCDCRLSTDLYSARYRGSLSSIPSPGGDFGPSRRHSWRPNAAASFDGWRTPAVIPGGTAGHGMLGAGGGGGGSMGSSVGGQLTRSTWSSMPSSPTHVQPPSAALVARLASSPPRRTRSKVTFQECPMIRGSLPNLRSELLADNSGDSTESLLDEAEDYLRRSIDSMLTLSTAAAAAAVAAGEHCSGRHSARRRRARRHSEPDLFREWNPPQDARPYLPKIPRDLKLDHLVKVISPEGRILQGRVRYVGPVAGREEVHVGVELPNESGSSDGTFHGRRYFDCPQSLRIYASANCNDPSASAIVKRAVHHEQSSRARKLTLSINTYINKP
ncbi:uncharacterized protein LOC100678758 isoform X1 [Nasonia vitripennis]|uniref:CAP-Gly domain-containing protein n=1 Tax=Nasonia vitripennis TaxID=7425 RepID=A0A7M7T6U5_NASVI|nr:uncharacterized protein LOC100678758 isoform X1 [Nasonia vitripennis]XP_031778522.1 uncharacterized protein LOC100678758 isoform X1 [Nasonia vitripennis]